jgi:hypothetical protein
MVEQLLIPTQVLVEIQLLLQLVVTAYVLSQLLTLVKMVEQT